MLSAHDTAYPLLRSHYPSSVLERDYTPSSSELVFVCTSSKGKASRLALLTLLKVVQRLGYFPLLSEVPEVLPRFLAGFLGYEVSQAFSRTDDRAGSRRRQLARLRTHLQVHLLDGAGRLWLEDILKEAAHMREDLVDLVNIALEELVRERFELPAFSTLLELAQKARLSVNAGLHQVVLELLSEKDRTQLETLWQVDEAQSSPWNALRADPGKLSKATVDAAIVRFHAMQSLPMPDLEGVLSSLKRDQFAEEARSLDAWQMRRLEKGKAYSLAAILVLERRVRLHDDIAGMLVKATLKLHTQARETHALEEMRRLHRAGVLVGTLKKVVVAYGKDGTDAERYGEIHRTLEGREQSLLEACEAFELAGLEAYLPFLKKHFPAKRKMLLDLLETLPISWVVPTPLEAAWRFVQARRCDRDKEVSVNGPGEARLSLGWVPKGWHRLLFGEEVNFSSDDQGMVFKLNPRVLELCVLTQVSFDLRSGAAYTAGGRDYGDWRTLLVSKETFEAERDRYLEQTGLPRGEGELLKHLRQQLLHKAQQFNGELERSSSSGAELRDGELVLKPLEKRLSPERLSWLHQEIGARMPQTNLLDALIDSARLTRWEKFFGPHSGASDRLEKPLERYLTTVFSYGCNVGASQTARAFTGVDRRDIAWIDTQHISESKLERAIAEVVNAYSKFSLPRFWGDGKSVVADGTKWSMYEENLLAEYHIRYGGYGGIGYYHVSDTYIALFTHFIPCGTWEAVHILDGMLQQQSDLEPDTLHADTQGQSLPVFGLSYLLGIQLMPRIRNWKDLILYRASSAQKLGQVGGLLSQTIDWKLLERYLPELLRLAVSIKLGRVMPSTILKRLNSYSRQNPFYGALCELGKVVRTLFLLRYLGDLEVRRRVLYTTNKIEQYNAFTQWVSFGGEGKMLENHRDRQRKRLKYIHLVTNCLVYHNVYQLTEVLKTLEAEGHEIPTECLSFINPYMTGHLNRLGTYTLNLERDIPEADYAFKLGGGIARASTAEQEEADARATSG